MQEQILNLLAQASSSEIEVQDEAVLQIAMLLEKHSILYVEENGFVARIRMKSCGYSDVVSFSCDEKESHVPHPQLARV